MTPAAPLLTLVTDRSASGGPIVSVSVAESLVATGSTTPGAETVAVFPSVPEAARLTVAMTVNVTVPPLPAGNVTGTLAMLPVPLGDPTVAPPVAAAVQEAAEIAAGRVSLTAAFVTASGPALV